MHGDGVAELGALRRAVDRSRRLPQQRADSAQQRQTRCGQRARIERGASTMAIRAGACAQCSTARPRVLRSSHGARLCTYSAALSPRAIAAIRPGRASRSCRISRRTAAAKQGGHKSTRLGRPATGRQEDCNYNHRIVHRPGRSAGRSLRRCRGAVASACIPPAFAQQPPAAAPHKPAPKPAAPKPAAKPARRRSRRSSPQGRPRPAISRS